jgi:hypothetical protein
MGAIIDSNVILMSASDLEENFLDLVDANLVSIWDGNFSYI